MNKVNQESKSLGFDVERMKSLCIFDISEIENSYEFYDEETELSRVIEGAGLLLKAAERSLMVEDLWSLECITHKLRGLFTISGCNRLSYLLENIYNALTAIQVDYVKDLLLKVKEEFYLAKQEIAKFLKTLEVPQVSLAGA